MATHIALLVSIVAAMAWCGLLIVSPPWTAQPGRRIATWLVAGLVTALGGLALVVQIMKGI